jgi:O-methyltransferase
VRRLLRRRRSHASAPDPEPAPVEPPDRAIVDRVRPYTLTSEERLLAVIDSVRYLVRRGVPGAFAECGVWRGGSVLAMVLALQELGVRDRDLHLYDTFEGMTEPTEHDTSPLEAPALVTWREAQAGGERPWPEYFDPETFNEDAVRATLIDTGYPADRIHLHRGPVEQTLPAAAPDGLALLRLDTDWYESTRHELEHLYPRLSTGGVLIVDDYGHWEGARRAVDEYFASGAAEPVLLSRIDYTGRIAIKH